MEISQGAAFESTKGYQRCFCSRSEEFVITDGFGLSGFICWRYQPARTTEGTLHVHHPKCYLLTNRTPLEGSRGKACRWGKPSEAETVAHSFLHFQSPNLVSPHISPSGVGNCGSSFLSITTLRSILQEIHIQAHFLRLAWPHPLQVPSLHNSPDR